MSKHLLLIDDEDWFVEPILDRLSFEGIQCRYCRTGFAGLKEFRAHPNRYGIVILDMKLSMGERPRDVDVADLDGYRVAGIYLLEKIRSLAPDLPVIGYTVLDDQSIREAIGRLGGIHLAKAADEDELYRLIHHHLRKTDDV